MPPRSIKSSIASVKRKKSRRNLLAMLNPDIFLSIARHLNVEDILSLRQTCKHGANLTRQRTIWVHLLLLRSKAACIHPTTYSIPSMSSLELENAVLAAYKMEARLHSVNPTPKRTRILSLRLKDDVGSTSDDSRSESDSDGSPDFSITALSVVPGGRYIITLSANRWLRCWDIRDSAARPVASWASERMMYGLRVQMSSRNPSELVIAVWEDACEEERLFAKIFTLCLDDDEPLATTYFVCQRSLKESSSCENTVLDGDMLLWIDGDDINIVNWERNEWGALSLREPYDDEPIYYDYLPPPANVIVMRAKNKTYFLVFQQTCGCLVYRQFELPPMFPTLEAANSSRVDNHICRSTFPSKPERSYQTPLSMWLPYMKRKGTNGMTDFALLYIPKTGEASFIGLTPFKENTSISSHSHSRPSNHVVFLPSELGIGSPDTDWPCPWDMELDVTTRGNLIAFWVPFSSKDCQLYARFLDLHPPGQESDTASKHGSEHGSEEEGTEDGKSPSRKDGLRTIVCGRTRRVLGTSMWTGQIFCLRPDAKDGSIRVFEYA